MHKHPHPTHFFCLFHKFLYTFRDRAVCCLIRNTYSLSSILFDMVIAYLLFTTKTHSYGKFFAIRHRILLLLFSISLSCSLSTSVCVCMYANECVIVYSLSDVVFWNVNSLIAAPFRRQQ